MVGTIRPVVYRQAQFDRWFAAAGLHVVANVAGATMIGLAIGAAGWWLTARDAAFPAALFVSIGVLSVGYALAEVGLVRLPYPQVARQVPSQWYGRFHPLVTATLYGLSLGTGITTHIVTATVYVVLAGLLLQAEPMLAAVTFGLFGVGRGLSVFALGWFSHAIAAGDDLFIALQRIGVYQEPLHRLGGLFLASIGAYVCTALVVDPVHS